MVRVESGLLEREVESGVIAEAVKETVRGAGGLLLIEGPAGIGKTRLLDEVEAQAAEARTAVVRAQASELERDFAFGVVRQLFEPLLATADPAQQSELWQGPAAQAREVFAPADAGPTAGSAGDFAVLHGLYWLTASACQHHPLILLLDDLQWCDAPSLRYLAHLLPRITDFGILIAVALRTGEAATDERLLLNITTDSATLVVRPHALSTQGTALLLEQALPTVDPAFVAACHRATGGNPLLIRELARTVTAEGMTTSAARVADLGSQAITRLVAARLARLPQAAEALVQAVAVLGDGAELTTAAALAGQNAITALESTAALEQLEILRIRSDDDQTLLSFVHPLVRSAVHDGISLADVAAAHHRAAQLLTAAGADLERVAAHLLRVPPAGERQTVEVLRKAAEQAALRGSPQSAFTYLDRALQEPPTDDDLLDVLKQAGKNAEAVDNRAAAQHLEKALALTEERLDRARIAQTLGNLFLLLGRSQDAADVWTNALAQLPDGHEDLAHRMHAGLVNLGLLEPDRADLRAKAAQLHDLPFKDSLGGRELASLVACWDAFRGDPSAIRRARNALSDDVLITRAPGGSALPTAWLVLVSFDDAAVVQSIETGVAQAYRRGAVRDLTAALTYRALCQLHRGDLADAETDARECVTAIETSAMAIARPFLGPFLADILLEQGRPADAQAALTWVGLPDPPPLSGPLYFYLEAQARLLRAQGQLERGLQTARAAGERFSACDGSNPAICAWRAEAAQCLHALGRTDDARTLATEELHDARRWGAPRALGQALRVTGLVTGGKAGTRLLQEAIIVLKDSPARLEYAKALADLGAVLRCGGHRTDARPHLRHALDLATQCGASPLVELARTELAAAGGRPRNTALSGPDALTPSERRVAERAADGATNRQIAQQLYVTPKTVEVHLSAAYRKLGITTRTQLSQALASS
ncbi:ATP-binding protein [Streptomyces sp. NPDC055109]